MPTFVLGMSAVYQHSEACLVLDGEIVDAAAEKDLNRQERARQ